MLIILGYVESSFCVKTHRTTDESTWTCLGNIARVNDVKDPAGEACGFLGKVCPSKMDDHSQRDITSHVVLANHPLQTDIPDTFGN